jgi:hypothetical protein
VNNDTPTSYIVSIYPFSYVATMVLRTKCRHHRRLRIRSVKKLDYRDEVTPEFTLKLAVSARTMKQMAHKGTCDLCQFLCEAILKHGHPNISKRRRNRWTGPVWMSFDKITAADLQEPIITSVKLRFYWHDSCGLWNSAHRE